MLNYSPNSAIFQNSWLPSTLGLLFNSTAKWLDMALVVGLYTVTLKLQEKNLLYSFKTFIQLKTGFGLCSQQQLGCC